MEVVKHTDFDKLEATIAGLPSGDVEMQHHFAPGVYGREMRIPAGVMATGKIHRNRVLNIVCGDITVFNKQDGTKRRIIGYEAFVSEPGTRRAVYAHSFTVWTCIHPTQETDLEKIEAEVIQPYQNPLLKNCEKNQITGGDS